MPFNNPSILFRAPTSVGQAAPIDVVTGLALTIVAGSLAAVDAGGGRLVWRATGHVDLSFPGVGSWSIDNTGTTDKITGTIAAFMREQTAPSIGSFLRVLAFTDSADMGNVGLMVDRTTTDQLNVQWNSSQSPGVAVTLSNWQAVVAQVRANDATQAGADRARMWAGTATGAGPHGAVTGSGGATINRLRIGAPNGAVIDYERVAAWFAVGEQPTEAESETLRQVGTTIAWDATLAGTDIIAPNLSSPSGTGGALSATGSVSTNEGTGTLYYRVTSNPTETVPAQGSPMTGWASQAVAAAGVQNVSATGLTAGPRYLHFVHDDAAGNRSAISSSAVFTVATGAPVYSVALSPAAHNTGAGRKVSTTFTGTIVWDGDFDAVAGKSITPIPSTAVDAQGNCTLTGLTQTGPALVLRKWADGASSAELVNVV